VIQHDDVEQLIDRQIELSSTRADDPSVPDRDQELHSHAYVLAMTLQKPSRLPELVEVLEQTTFEIAAARILKQRAT
jgi:hypothetical protein